MQQINSDNSVSDDQILTNPTVGDVIAYLQKLPPDIKFRIEDTDTNWTMARIHFNVADGYLFLSGRYDEMSSQEDDY